MKYLILIIIFPLWIINILLAYLIGFIWSCLDEKDREWLAKIQELFI